MKVYSKFLFVVFLITESIVFCQTIIPINEGNKWWYSGRKCVTYNPEGQSCWDVHTTIEITDFGQNGENSFVINNSQQWYIDSTTAIYKNFYISGEKISIVCYDTSITDTSYSLNDILQSTGGRYSLETKWFELLERQVKTQFTIVSSEYTYKKIAISPGIGIVYFIRSWDDYQTAEYKYYKLQRWRIDGQYHGKPSSPKGLTVRQLSNKKMIRWRKNPENNVSYYNVYLQDHEERTIKKISTESAEDTVFYFQRSTAESAIKIKQVKIAAISDKGHYSEFSDVVPLSPTGLKGEKDDQKKEFYRVQNYPNPFNSSTKIKFSLNTITEVKLSVFDINGEKVESLLDDTELSEGHHIITWKAKNIPSGIYFIKLTVGDQIQIKKCSLLQ